MSRAQARSIERLDACLSRSEHGDDVMLLTELDGFLAGLAVSPEPVPPAEWLDVVWDGDGAVFESDRAAAEARRLVVGHFNRVLRRLDRPGGYAPVLEDDLDGSPLWEIWIAGFGKAVALRPDGWEAYAEAEDEDVRVALGVFLRLLDLADTVGSERDDVDAELDGAAPALIAGCLETLHRARPGGDRALAAGSPARRVGRNDPCPCGSGRKYKKCCLP